ncbi:MAG: hypothetical protein RSA00_03035, partial [Hydrogenoanaerobacterium sp.]
WINPMSARPQAQAQEAITPPQEWQQEPTMPFMANMPGEVYDGVAHVPQSPSGIKPVVGMGELSGLTAINLFNQPTAVNEQSLQYLNGFLLTQIGKRVTVEFLIGSNTMVTKTGTLLGVGANYILISEFPTNNLLSCDFFSIKFITFYYQ